MKIWLLMAIAIATEITATSMLKISDGFSKPLPTLVALLGYSISFYLLSLILRIIPVGIAYAIWSGVGIVAVSIIGWLVLHQKLDWPAIVGISMIVGGVLVINLFSNAGH